MEISRFIGQVNIPLCADYDRRKDLSVWLNDHKFKNIKDWADSPKTSGFRKRHAEGVNEKLSCNTCLAMMQMSEEIQDAVDQRMEQEWATPLMVPGSTSTSTQFDPHHVPRQKTSTKDVPEIIQTRGHLFRQSDYGPNVFLWDGVKTKHWTLFTHAAYLTYCHQDAGYCTYTIIRNGCKIWAVLSALIDVPGAVTRKDLYDTWRTMLRPPPNLQAREVSTLFYIFLLEGDVLVQPAGVAHQVYTPVNTITDGGHFMTYETLHLIELTRKFQRPHHTTATNSDHAAIHRHICRLAIALKVAFRDKSKYLRLTLCFGLNLYVTAFYRRPILALAAMVCQPEDYEPSRSEDDRPLGLPRYDLLRAEVENDSRLAKQIMTFIIRQHGLTLDDVMKELDDMGADWKDGTRETLDLSCLDTFTAFDTCTAPL